MNAQFPDEPVPHEFFVWAFRHCLTTAGASPVAILELPFDDDMLRVVCSPELRVAEAVRTVLGLKYHESILGLLQFPTDGLPTKVRIQTNSHIVSVGIETPALPRRVDIPGSAECPAVQSALEIPFSSGAIVINKILKPNVPATKVMYGESPIAVSLSGFAVLPAKVTEPAA